MLSFRSFRSKLTVLYAGLFALGLLMVSAQVYIAISGNVARMVRGELTASSTVFDRVWALRDAQLENGASLLSRDYGFRSALATHDTATISSAVANLRTRLGVDSAFVIGADGASFIGDPGSFRRLSPTVLGGLEGSDATAGVFVVDGKPYQAVSTPVLAPMPVGWVVFASVLDRAQAKTLEKLSAIPLDASVLARGAGGAWRNAADPETARLGDRAGQFVDATLKQGGEHPARLNDGSGDSLALVKPLNTMDSATPVVLVLRYPMARAMAPYRAMMETMAVIGLSSIGLLFLGSWAVARGVTRPLSLLEAAAKQLQRGETPSLTVTARDEIGQLAETFNVMAAEIGERERRITHLALHDIETGLPNRESLAADVNRLVGRVGEKRAYVVALSVDRFAHVRGAIGHNLFNELIRRLGERIGELEPEMNRARLTTVSLAVAFEAASEAEVMARADALRTALQQPLTLDGAVVDVSLTAGVASCARDADRVASPIDRANIAIDQARAAHRGQAVFCAETYGDPASNLSLMSEMRASIEAGHMVLHHQPKFDLREQRVTAAEVLVRWNHPTRGFLRPDLFIGMAEETGHIRELTEWVLGQAVEDQKRLADAGFPLSISVNISGRLLSDVEFADAALALVADSAGPICFEITETAIIEKPEVAIAVIDRLTAADVAISIDDYGTGLSSLAYLKQIRANELKVDKSFVTSMDSGQRDALLVRSTINLAHSLGMKVTAEGVETPTALALLAGMGCDLAQGYLIAKPMPIEDFLTFMERAEPPVEAHAGGVRMRS